MKLQEDLIQFVWSIIKTLKFDLVTTTSSNITIDKPGFLNRHEGPDFKESLITIGGQLWAGNVEVHVNSSDWNHHNHSIDPNYSNVILHVVYHHDVEIVRSDGTNIPVLELKKYISAAQLEVYRSLMYNQLSIPCQHIIKDIEPIYLSLMLNTAMVTRLKVKSEQIIERLNVLNGDWNTAFYYQLAENFGFKTNSKPMLALAQSISINLLAKHKESYHQLLALLFGQAQFLPQRGKDEYTKELIKEYQYLKKAYQLEPVKDLSWKFVKTRPANFPTIRIAQFVNLISCSSHLFSTILETNSTVALINLFNSETDAYWLSHSHFGQLSKGKLSGKLGASSLQLILINTVVPMLFSYGEFTQDENLKEKALNLLQALPAEQNRIVKTYQNIGFTIKTAAESQGVLGLNKYYCNERQCMKCGVGQKLLLDRD